MERMGRKTQEAVVSQQRARSRGGGCGPRGRQADRGVQDRSGGGADCTWEETEVKNVGIWSLNQSWKQGHLWEESRSLTGCPPQGSGPRNLYF